MKYFVRDLVCDVIS